MIREAEKLDIEKKLLNCLKHVGIIVEEDELDMIEDFIEDSITFITLIVEIEQEFDIEIPDEFLSIERMATISSIKEMITAQKRINH